MTKPNLILLVAVSVLGWACVIDAQSCNIGVADSSVTRNGRGLLWKERMGDTSGNSQVAYFTGPQYNYIGMRAVGDTDGAWMGLNEAGLCTGNSYVSTRWNNNALMNHVLGNFSTVAEVRAFIQQEFAAGTLTATGCFPFLDAAGNATIFEIRWSDWMIEYNTQDPDRAPQSMLGWVVRANEFHQQADGRDDTSIGGRYESAAYNIGGLIGLDLLSAQTVVQGNDGTSGYEYTRYGPGRPLATLAAPTVRSSMVVQGVAPGEDPALTTMWAMPGPADYSIAIPTWTSVSDIPDCLSTGDFTVRAKSLYVKGNETITQASTLAFEAHLFAEVDELLSHWRSVGIPSSEEITRVEIRCAEDAYSLLDCLDNVQDDNLAPTIELVVADMSEQGLYFEPLAEDEDGLIQTYLWNFGDDETSSAESVWHTYTDPGWYLVSCTVTDDDGVSVTDWRYCHVPARLGDLNCDGTLNSLDIDPFVLALSDLEGYRAGYPNCTIINADVNRDGSIDVLDIDPLVELLTGG